MPTLTAGILYEGPSQIDGVPIVMIATGWWPRSSDNDGTGPMVQTWILLQDVSPLVALKTGEDVSICGSCLLRAGACYVMVKNAPTSVYRCYKRGGYKRITLQEARRMLLRRSQGLRAGSYGDHFAVPLEVWRELLGLESAEVGPIEATPAIQSAVPDGNVIRPQQVPFWTGYTECWPRQEAQGYRDFLMASCTTELQGQHAMSKGWRPYLITPDDIRPAGYMRCPKSHQYREQTNKYITCHECQACDGSGGRWTKPVYIPAHGGKFQVARTREIVLAARADELRPRGEVLEMLERQAARQALDAVQSKTPGGGPEVSILERGAGLYTNTLRLDTGRPVLDDPRVSGAL